MAGSAPQIADAYHSQRSICLNNVSEYCLLDTRYCKVIIQLEQVMPHVIELFSTLIEQRDKAGWWQS